MIRYRFGEEQIEKLNQIDWPRWDDRRIKENISHFYDIDEFLDLCERE